MIFENNSLKALNILLTVDTYSLTSLTMADAGLNGSATAFSLTEAIIFEAAAAPVVGWWLWLWLPC